MFIKSGGLKKIGIWLAIWGFVKTIWDAIGHIGNVQTLWDMISAAVQYWPSFLRGTVWVVTSWWFALIASTICLLLWWFLSHKEKSFAAVTFEDAIIVPRDDGTQVLRHHGAAGLHRLLNRIEQRTKEARSTAEQGILKIQLIESELLAECKKFDNELQWREFGGLALRIEELNNQLRARAKSPIEQRTPTPELLMAAQAVLQTVAGMRHQIANG